MLHCNILTFKVVLNSKFIERRERQKIQKTKVSMKFRMETNPSKYHRQVPVPGPVFQWQGIGPARTWCSAATDPLLVSWVPSSFFSLVSATQFPLLPAATVRRLRINHGDNESSFRVLHPFRLTESPRTQAAPRLLSGQNTCRRETN